MRIEEELKLDYSDVLFRPKRSTLKSRKDVNLLRTYRFKYSKNEWSGIPIMAANNIATNSSKRVAGSALPIALVTGLSVMNDLPRLGNLKPHLPSSREPIGTRSHMNVVYL